MEVENLKLQINPFIIDGSLLVQVWTTILMLKPMKVKLEI